MDQNNPEEYKTTKPFFVFLVSIIYIYSLLEIGKEIDAEKTSTDDEF